METKQKNTGRKPNSNPASANGNKKPRASSGENRRSQRKQTQEQPKPSADVVYLAPKPFSRNRLVLHLATVAAVVLAFLLGISVFFKVDEIRVSGAQQYSAWEILQASGVEQGDNLLTFNRARAAGKIQTALPYVKTVRIGIKLPDTVNIVIEEIPVTYGIKDTSGNWWLVSSGGKVLEPVSDGEESGFTKILGVQLKNPAVGQQAAAYQEAPAATGESGEMIPVTVTAAERLRTALDIASYLEQNGIIGEATSVDVNNLFDIQLWYGQQFQVKLGQKDQLGYKIKKLKAVVTQYSSYESGVLDISDPDEIYYQKFS